MTTRSPGDDGDGYEPLTPELFKRYIGLEPVAIQRYDWEQLAAMFRIGQQHERAKHVVDCRAHGQSLPAPLCPICAKDIIAEMLG